MIMVSTLFNLRGIASDIEQKICEMNDLTTLFGIGYQKDCQM